MMMLAKLKAAAVITIAALAVGGAAPMVVNAVKENNHNKGYITGDTELLPLIAKGFQSNLEMIKTWKGIGVIHTTADNIVPVDLADPTKPKTKKNGVKDYTENTEFLIDVVADKLRWSRINIDGFIESKEGSKPVDLFLITAGLSNKDMDCYINPYSPDMDERAPRHIVIYPKGTILQSRAMDAFNPYYIMQEDIGKDIVNTEQLIHYYNWVKNNELKVTTGFIEKVGDIVTFETNFAKENEETTTTIFKKIVFDLSKGCNPIEVFKTWQGGTYHWKFDYEVIEGIFVPKSIYIDISFSPPNPIFKSRKKIILTTEMLNKPVSPDEFEFEKIGVRPGDYINETTPVRRKYKWGKDPETNPGLSKAEMTELVEDFFQNNFRDITSRETIEWGEVTVDEDGNSSIRYKAEVTIWNRDKMIMNQIFTFDKDRNYVSARHVEGFPQPVIEEDAVDEEVSKEKDNPDIF